MIEYVKNIPDFWSEHIVNFEFPHNVSMGQRDYFHPNYFLPSAEILQAFDEEVPCKEIFINEIGTKQGSISLICLEPGKVVPIHKDKFYKFRKDYNVDVDDCLRHLIFLQDWSLGQIVEFENKVITKWNKGDVWIFDTQQFHYAANASNSNFITCQVNTVK